jgi:cytochrome c-type biogenesis protein CcmH/NrfF
MRHELRAELQSGESDAAILNSFVRNYGAEVIEHSSSVSNELILVVVLGVLTSAVIAFARKRKSRTAVVATAPNLLRGDLDTFRDRVRREVEADDWL